MNLIGNYNNMEIDFVRLDRANAYGKSLLRVLKGEDKSPLTDYPDTSDQSIVQFFFDMLDEDLLYNEVICNDIQDILDLWLVEDITPQQAKKQLLDLFADHFDFGC